MEPPTPLDQISVTLKSLYCNFSDEEWHEVQQRDICIARLGELKASSADPPTNNLVKRESPEVQSYCRWWKDLCQDEAGVWTLKRANRK